MKIKLYRIKCTKTIKFYRVLFIIFLKLIRIKNNFLLCEASVTYATSCTVSSSADICQGFHTSSPTGTPILTCRQDGWKCSYYLTSFPRWNKLLHTVIKSLFTTVISYTKQMYFQPHQQVKGHYSIIRHLLSPKT